MSEVAYEYSWKLANTGTSTTGTVYWTSRTVTQTPGWLSIIGVGPTESVNTTIKTAHSALRTTTVGSSIGTGFMLFRNGDSQPFVRCLDTAFAAALAAPPMP